MPKKHDRNLRIKAVELFDIGFGHKATAKKLALSQSIVKHWLTVYRAVGREVLLGMGKSHKSYDYALKRAAVADVLDNKMTKQAVMAKYSIASKSPLDKWIHDFLVYGEEALRSKPKGRPSKNAFSNHSPQTREAELEERVRYLEAELAYLKKLSALEATKRLPGKSAR